MSGLLLVTVAFSGLYTATADSKAGAADQVANSNLRSSTLDLDNEVAGHEAQQHSHAQSRSRIIMPAQVQQDLRICNAYAWTKPLDIYHVSSNKKLTGDEPLNYKDCRDFKLPLQEGDEIEFKSGELEVGTFYATGIPQAESSLLLIPRRRDANSMAVQFESHAFASLLTAQIAVVDAYKGVEHSSLKIADPKAVVQASKSNVALVEEVPAEELRYNSVVALNPGKYEISLVSDKGDMKKEVPINVKNEAKYIVMRVGTKPTASAPRGAPSALDDYPEEIVVFPQLGSFAFGVRMNFVVTCLVIVVAAVL